MKHKTTAIFWIKMVRWRARRIWTALRWSAQALESSPIVFGNAMPKSGSHLIHQILQGLPHLGPFVNPGFPPVNRDPMNDKLLEREVIANIKRLQSGDIAYGYLKARPPFPALFAEPGMAMIFVYRDPRDTIISHVFYATQLHPGHGMYRHYTQDLNTMEARIHAAIEGVEIPGSELSPIRDKYQGYIEWLESPEVLCLRFEDLILDRRNALIKILSFLETRGFISGLSRQRQLDLLERSISPEKSGTFRKGQPGNWREYFTDANKSYFKMMTGDLLLRLGYEQADNW